MKQANKIDLNGSIIDPVIVEDDFVNTGDIIAAVCPDGFYKPRWDGMAWVEGLTQIEIDAIKNQPQQPTELELANKKIETLETQLSQTNTDFQDFMTFFFENNPDLA